MTWSLFMTKPKPKQVPPQAPKRVLTDKDLLNEYDLSTRVAAGIKRLGARSAMRNGDFAKFCEVATNHLANVRDEFPDFWVLARGGDRLWFGSKEFADEMRPKIT